MRDSAKHRIKELPHIGPTLRLYHSVTVHAWVHLSSVHNFRRAWVGVVDVHYRKNRYLKVIKLVQDHPVLYDTSYVDYMRSKMKDELSRKGSLKILSGISGNRLNSPQAFLLAKYKFLLLSFLLSVEYKLITFSLSYSESNPRISTLVITWIHTTGFKCGTRPNPWPVRPMATACAVLGLG